MTELDTGWSKNVVTDLGRRRLASLIGWTATLRLFLHEGTNASNVRLTSLGFAYPAAQTPAQIQSPDTTTLDSTLLLQTRTKLFAVPLLPDSRTVNIVGICATTALVSRFVHDILAFTKLSTPIVQGPTQAADVTYRVTWSLD